MMKCAHILIFIMFTLCKMCTLTAQSVYSQIFDQNNISLDRTESEFNSDRYGEYLKWAFHSQLNLWEYRKRSIVFSLLDKHTLDIDKNNVVNDPIVWKDLTFFCGQKDVKLYLADKIDRTHTMLGRGTLYGMLVQATTDTVRLKKQQDFIRNMLDDEKLFSELDNALTEFNQSENVFLSFFGIQDFFKPVAARRYFSYGKKSLNEILNRNPFCLSVRTLLDHIQRMTVAATTILAAPLLPICAIAQFADYSINESVKQAGENLRGAAIPSFALFSSMIKSKWVLGSFSIAAGVISGLNIKESVQWMTDNFLIDYYLQIRIMHVARIIDCLKKINSIVRRHPQLLRSLKKFNALETLFDNLQNKPDLKRLFKMLNSDALKSTPSLLTNKGTVFVAYKLFVENKQIFQDSMLALGELDAYFSLARYFKEHINTNNACCFVEYMQQNEPAVRFEDFWNPFLDVKSVVTNSINLGGKNKKNMIITGPNAGGKSTLLKAIAINCIMAQSFGIVCAKKAFITPFYKIMTYLNITDDIGAGNSLFKAQVLRAQYILDSIKGLSSDQFSFSIIDEMFNGTSPKEAEACAFSVAKNLGGYSNNMSIVATHFGLLTELEKETPHFTNYHVGVTHQPNGRIMYPFKLQQGISDQHVALDILKAEGFEGSIVADAQHILSFAL